jgi:ubiquinone biosynthesis protein
MVSIVHAVRDIGRLREIASVLVRHGFGEFVQRVGLLRTSGQRETSQSDRALVDGVDPDDAAKGATEQKELGWSVRLRRVLEDLGPSFIKLGQIASTRGDLLPPELIVELKKLQDSAPLVPFSAIETEIERSLGVGVSDLFESLDETPLAAASIAQVHRAVLRAPEGNAQVVVKVQRPGVAETIASDLDLLHTLAALIERALPETHLYSPVGLVRQFDRAIRDELDFTQEAENASHFARNFEGFQDIRFPRIYREASSKRVITLEYFDGKKLEEAILAGTSARRIAKIALTAMVKQIFEDGFFHADPHPGNVIVLGEGDTCMLGLIDLGMVGRLSPRLRDLTIDLMVAASRSDYEGIADALYAIGTPSRRVELSAFQMDVARLSERYLGRSLKDIEASVFIRDLLQLAAKYGLEIPTDFVLVAKAMMTVEGIGKQIDPSLDLFAESRPLFLNLLKRRYSPERLGLQLLKRVERLGAATSNLPQQLQDVLEDVRLGRLLVRTEDPGQQSATDRLGRRLMAGFLVASSTIGSTLLNLNGRETLGWLLFALGGSWLAGHVISDFFRSTKNRGPR